ncbi:MAG: alpha/beta fold hydrolase [Roseburia sp.]
MKKLEEYKSKAGIFRNAAGGTNYYISYFPKNPIANVVICHGFCEFAEKYEEVIEVFLEKGYAVYLPEHRGHGYSQRECEDWEKVYIHSYQDYVDDLYYFIQKKIVLKEKKLILFAHSMGGAIGALFLEQYPTIFDAAVFSAPMFRMNLGKCPQPVAALIAQIACLAGKEMEYAPGEHGFDGKEDFLHSSCTSVESYERIFKLRKECIAYQTYGGTYGWLKAGISATRQLLKRKNMKKIRTPILIFQAEQDSLVKNRAHVKFLIGTDHTSLVQIRGSKHEIFHAGEEQRREYYQALFSFLAEELSEKIGVKERVYQTNERKNEKTREILDFV